MKMLLGLATLPVKFGDKQKTARCQRKIRILYVCFFSHCERETKEKNL